MKKAKRLHAGLIVSQYGNSEENEDKKIVAIMHNHLPEYSEIITATDICTTMLYEKFAGWETNYVMSKKYVSIWNCKSDELIVMTIEAWKKISDNQSKE